jgi:hypothetical protein
METLSILPKQDLDDLLDLLRKDPAAFFEQPMLFSWWVHGGEPGPDHLSNALDLTSENGVLEVVYVRPVFDLDFDPPYLTEKFSDSIDLDRAKTLLEEMFGAGLFEREYAEEEDPGIADNLKETWQFERGSTQLEKTLFEPFPDGLDPLREICNALVTDLLQSGQRELKTPDDPDY